VPRGEPVTATPPRSGAIDAVRVLGIAAVIAGHTWGIPLARPLFYTWHVPLFFFLAGYFWSEHRSVGADLSKRAWTLAAPYLTWFVLIGLVSVPVQAIGGNFSVSRLFGPFINGEDSAMPYTTFWFVSALFATIVLRRLVGFLPKAMAWVIAIGGGVAGVLLGPALAKSPLAIGSALGCLIFVLLGQLARDLHPRIARPGTVGLALLVASAVLVATGVSAPLDIKQGNYGTPGVSILVAAAISFGLVLVSEPIFRHLPAAVHRGATILAFAGFAVVLVHPLVFWLMLKFTPWAGHWLIFAVTLTVSWCIGVAALRSPAARWLTGVDPTRVRATVHPTRARAA